MADRLVLHVVPASHPCVAVERALQLKGLAYDRVVHLPVLHTVPMRVLFGRRTVPGIVFPDGARAVGSMAILRVLDGLEPHPRLVPDDDALRARVEAAETWGDTILQPMGRRIPWTALSFVPPAMMSFSAGYELPIPDAIAARSTALVIRAARTVNRANPDAVMADLRALPGHLDRIDDWIADGTIGGATPNVADLQLLSTVRLLSAVEDLQPWFAGRPATAKAGALFPVYPGSVPAGALPAEWLPAAP